MNTAFVFVWNVRGLNGRARRDSVREFVSQEHASIVCLQETKLQVVSVAIASEILGTMFDYVVLPSLGAAGGIMLGWRTDMWSISGVRVDHFSLSALLTNVASNSDPWWITIVYGPQLQAEKQLFLGELLLVRSSCAGAWLLCGDFNMICHAEDKNTRRLDHRGMRRFMSFLHGANVEELHLSGRRFTWSNRRERPTLERLDRVFASPEWLGLFPSHLLRPLSSDCSDHCPLLLRTDAIPWAKCRFRFEAFWAKLPGLLDAIKIAWTPTLLHADPFQVLDYKLRNTANALKAWAAKKVGSVRLQLSVAREVIKCLDTAEEARSLSSEEQLLRNELKVKCLGLASLSRTIARLRSRIHYLAEGDANTKFFHLQACHRARKNHNHSINVDGVEVVDNNAMADALFNFYEFVLGTNFERSARIDLELLQLRTADLQGLDRCFTEDEVRAVIADLPPDKASGPDGCTGRFYKLAWPIIKDDIMHAINAFWSLNYSSFNLLNDAFMILLRKKEDPSVIKDYRPISLIHSFGKLIAKCLANRLAGVLNDLVHHNQSAFIRGRSIHDNFKTVQLTCRLLHQKKSPTVLLKIDIARAFDSVSWPFLLQVLEFLGFSRRWGAGYRIYFRPLAPRFSSTAGRERAFVIREDFGRVIRSPRCCLSWLWKS